MDDDRVMARLDAIQQDVSELTTAVREISRVVLDNSRTIAENTEAIAENAKAIAGNSAAIADSRRIAEAHALERVALRQHGEPLADFKAILGGLVPVPSRVDGRFFAPMAPVQRPRALKAPAA